MTHFVVNVMLNLKHNELFVKMPCICKFMSFAKTGAPLEHTKKNLIWLHGCILAPNNVNAILRMLPKIFNASTEFMFWLSGSYLIAFDCPDLAESDREGVFFSRQLQNNNVVFWIFKALSRHKSFSCKERYGNIVFCTLYKRASW